MAEITTRVLATADVADYRALRLRALRDEPRAFSDAFDDEVARPSEHFAAAMGASREHYTAGAFAAGALVAIATFKGDARAKARHKGYVHTMYVAPEARRGGVGARLLALVIDDARARGLEQLHLWVLDPAASAARRLYLRAGFAPQGAVVQADLKIDGSYVDAEYMTLRLAR